MNFIITKIFWFSVAACVVSVNCATNDVSKPDTDKKTGDRAIKACEKYSNLPLNVTGRVMSAEQEFPWMAALGYINYENLSVHFNCGGVVISDQYVLTTERCVIRPQVSLVRLGIHKPMDEDGFDAQNFNVKSVHRHPDSSFLARLNDIALVRVARKIEFTDFIFPACLEIDTGDRDSNVDLFITGYEHGSKGLRKAHLQTMSLKDCNVKLTEYGKMDNLTHIRNGLQPSQYCAFDPHGEKDKCDSLGNGIPLQYCPTESSLPHVVGVSSFEVNCDGTLPTVYTRIAHYLDWIEAIVWAME